MKYDFTSKMERKGHDAIALDAVGAGGFGPGAPLDGYDEIPMWVADMNFPTCPAVLQAIAGRLEHPHFGYFGIRDEYYSGIINWHKKRNGVTGLTPACIGYENGVLGGVASAIRAFAAPGDKILLHSPTYIGFTHSIEESGYRIILSELKKDEEGIWRMDYEDMDRKIREHQIHVAVFCSPHNPTGRVWEREELEKAMEVYRKNDCVVISDEIWSDILLDGHRHIPMQSVNEDAKKRVIALYSTSKTFSLAGLIGSYHIIYDSYLRDRVRAAAAKTHYNSINILSMYAQIGAASAEGMEWVDELCAVLSKNADYAYNHIRDRYDGIELAKPQGTYMLYLDCGKYCEQAGIPFYRLLKEGWNRGVGWQDGRPFHGPSSIRMNLASPFSRIEEAFERLDQFLIS